MKLLLIIVMLICFNSVHGQNNPQWKFYSKENKITLSSFFDGKQLLPVQTVDSCYKIDDIYFHFESKCKASFPGGTDSLNLFIKKNLYIPYYYNVIPKVYVAFIVTDSGKIKYCGIYRGFDDSYNKVALSIVEKMPDWEPAIDDGNFLSSFCVLKIDFSR